MAQNTNLKCAILLLGSSCITIPISSYFVADNAWLKWPNYSARHSALMILYSMQNRIIQSRTDTVPSRYRADMHKLLVLLIFNESSMNAL